MGWRIFLRKINPKGSINMTDYPKLPGSYYKHSIRTPDKRNREYFVYKPTGKFNGKVILFFHGGGGSGEKALNWQGFDQLAEQEGFMMVYPNGTKPWWQPWEMLTWNGGSCCGYAMDKNVDDVEFVAAMVSKLRKDFLGITGVYATGMSNGAIFIYRLAAETGSLVVRAIAPVAGMLGEGFDISRISVPILHFHGTADEFAPFLGGVGTPYPGTGRITEHRNVFDAVIEWGYAHHAGDLLVRTVGAKAIRYHYAAANSSFILWKLLYGGHTWPGGTPSIIGSRLLGEINRDVKATEEIWKFFKGL